MGICSTSIHSTPGPPSAAIITGYQGPYEENQQLAVECQVSDGIPPAYEYSWFLNNLPLSGEVQSSLTLDLTAQMNGQELYCKATHSLGTVQSEPVQLMVHRKYGFLLVSQRKQLDWWCMLSRK